MGVKKKLEKEEDLFGEAEKLSLKNKKDVKRLLELTQSPYYSIRMEALERCEVLFYEKDYKDVALQRTFEGLKDEDDLVRITCIENLMFWEYDKAIPEIRKTLWDLDQTVRIFSAEALAQFGDKKSIPTLEKLLEKAEDDFEKGAFLFALYDLGEKKYFEPLINIIHSDYYIAKIRFANVYVPKIVNKDNRDMILGLLIAALKKDEPVSVVEALKNAVQDLKKMKFE